MDVSFRHTAGCGERIEYNLIGKMLMEGLDVYVPLVDDHGVDCVIKKEDGSFIEVQIKARSNEVTDGDAALFAAIVHERRPNFYFVFYSERLELMWIMSSDEFLKECTTNKNGKNKHDDIEDCLTALAENFGQGVKKARTIAVRNIKGI